MTLISVLIALAVEHYLGHLQDFRRYQLFFDYADWLRERLGGEAGRGWVLLTLAVVPPVLVTALLQRGFDGGPLGLVFHLVALMFCFGPRDLDVELQRYREALSDGDDIAATRIARRLAGDEVPDDPAAQARAVAEAALWQAEAGIFGVLFWFALLGPTGAVLYRAVSLLHASTLGRGELGEALGKAFFVLDWLPARLAAVGYALGGHFESAIARWREHHAEYAGDYDSISLLVATGSGALEFGETDTGEERERLLTATTRLIWRTLFLWVFVIALFTLAGWAA